MSEQENIETNEDIPTNSEETLSPKELLVEEIKSVRYDSDLFNSFKEK